MELLLRMGFMELALFSKQYNENLVKEFYANLFEDFGNLESLAYGQVYVRGHVINFSPANIAHYLSCPHFSDIKGTGLEEETNFDEVTKVLTGDAAPVCLKTNRLNSNLMKMPYRALFRVFCKNWLPTTNVTIVLKERAHLLYAFATRKRINICTVILRNILRQIDQKKANKKTLPYLCLISEYLLGCRDLSLPSDSWESRPCLSPSVASHHLGPPINYRVGKLLPHQLANETRAPPQADSSLCSSAYRVLAAISNYCPYSNGRHNVYPWASYFPGVRSQKYSHPYPFPSIPGDSLLNRVEEQSQIEKLTLGLRIIKTSTTSR
ncbi:hypothetical protein M9H77_12215 [Catharanthus roseus]|uniref:Uncharacterized protein n=1 Tax=Catharanthus roseus TaxID=4058 RepID=A0ACC0BGQ8_CATRO|nr:hypothetical protein M9H77_12215 [Catharanthus roseus]